MPADNTILKPFNNPLIRFIVEPKLRWLRHTLFIVLGLILAYKGDVGSFNNQLGPAIQKAVLVVDTFTFLGIMGMIYLLMLVLIPKLLFRSKVFLFSICFFVLISLIYFLTWYVDDTYLKPMDTGGKMQHVELSFVAYVGICAVAAVLLGSVVGLAIFKKWIIDVQRMNELQEVNLRTELEQLKSQVNPHFLFNTLNNLLVLTKTDTERATQVLLGLSDLLRYQLYDSATESIVLAKDINFIENLLQLEKIRKNDFEYDIDIAGNIDGVKLPPFLFIPFVENAIKHGASTVGHSYLRLSFDVDANRLSFTSTNSKPAVKQKMVGGLGLKNISRRLQLLYPETHTLDIRDERDEYIVHLNLPL